MKKVFLILVLLVSVLGLSSGVSYAASYLGVPPTFSVQGKIANASITDGSYIFSIKLFDDDTSLTPIFTSVDIPANISNGIFSIIVSTATQNPVLKYDKLYFVETTIKNSSGIVLATYSRKMLTSVPYALNADRVGGLRISQIVTRDATTGQVIGLGTSNPPSGESFIDTSTSMQVKKGVLTLGNYSNPVNGSLFGGLLAGSQGTTIWARTTANDLGMSAVRGESNYNVSSTSSNTYGELGTMRTWGGVLKSMGVYGTSPDTAIYGETTGQTNTNYGVSGYSPKGSGVYGQSGSLYGVEGFGGGVAGVYGHGTIVGVQGIGSSYGLTGTSSSGAGVYGFVQNGIAVKGERGTSVGELGASEYQSGIYKDMGVYGKSNQLGVYGLTTSTDANSIGVAGYSSNGKGVSGGGVIGVHGNGSIVGVLAESSSGGTPLMINAGHVKMKRRPTIIIPSGSTAPVKLSGTNVDDNGQFGFVVNNTNNGAWVPIVNNENLYMVGESAGTGPTTAYFPNPLVIASIVNSLASDPQNLSTVTREQIASLGATSQAIEVYVPANSTVGYYLIYYDYGGGSYK